MFINIIVLHLSNQIIKKSTIWLQEVYRRSCQPVFILTLPFWKFTNWNLNIQSKDTWYTICKLKQPFFSFWHWENPDNSFYPSCLTLSVRSKVAVPLKSAAPLMFRLFWFWRYCTEKLNIVSLAQYSQGSTHDCGNCNEDIFIKSKTKTSCLRQSHMMSGCS